MKAKLMFQLPEEREEFKRATKADDLCSFIWEFENYLRSVYNGKITIEGDIIDTITDKWHDLKEDASVHLEEIWN